MKRQQTDLVQPKCTERTVGAATEGRPYSTFRGAQSQRLDPSPTRKKVLGIAKYLWYLCGVMLPSLSAMTVGALGALLWSYFCLSLAAYLKSRFRLRTGYTRKFFHLLVFISAAVVNAFAGFWAVCVFGLMVTLVVALAIFSGPGDRLYEALAREQDRPNSTYYIVIPYFATLIGGLISNILFGPLAVMGYLVGGLGDAAGEPAGLRWGRHPYTIPFGRTLVTKSFEGSLAVLVASIVALLIGVAISHELNFDVRSMMVLPVIAVLCTLVEAFSPRGWDNMPMQVIPTVLAAILLSK